jgi:predicted N-acetyltransferase YhbS
MIDATIHRLVDVPDAARTLAHWLREEWPHAYDQERADALIEDFGKQNGLPVGFVACTGGLGPIGMTAIVEGTTPSNAPVAMMVTLYVAPAFRGRGVGGALCCRAVAEANRLGCRTLGAYTVDKAEFYRSLGWRVVTRTIMPSNLPSRRLVWYVEQPDQTVAAERSLKLHPAFPSLDHQA